LTPLPFWSGLILLLFICFFLVDLQRWRRSARGPYVTTPYLLYGVGCILLIVGLAFSVRAGVELLSKSLEAAEPTGTAALAVVTIAALLFTLGQQLTDKTEAQSRFYLEEYRKGFDSALAVLESAPPGDPRLRMKWIAAARILESARRLSKKITVPAHRDVMGMDIPHQAQRFDRFLRMDAEYYYGASVGTVKSYGKDSLNEAARISTRRIGDLLNPHLEVEEKVIYTIWNAIQYPRDYADVLGEVFQEGQILFLPHSLRDYIQHTRSFQSAHGNLFSRADGAEIARLHPVDNYAEKVTAETHVAQAAPKERPKS
jgi:hypothetical protein